MKTTKRPILFWGEKKSILFEKLEEGFRASEKDIGAQGRSLTSLNSANRKLANRTINTRQPSYKPAPGHASYEPQTSNHCHVTIPDSSQSHIC